MKSSKKILKINNSGELVQYNEKLNRWELASISWEWSDIDKKHLKESKQNWEAYKKRIGE